MSSLVSARMLRLLLRKVNPLVGAEDAADDDAALDLMLADLQRLQLDLAVAEQDRIAFFNRAVRPGKFTETASSVPRIFRVVSTKGWRVCRRTRSPATAPMRIFGPGRSCRIATGTAELALQLANFVNDAAVKGVITVAEVQTRDVHAGAINPSIILSDEVAGPMVQTILVLRIRINVHE